MHVASRRCAALEARAISNGLFFACVPVFDAARLPLRPLQTRFARPLFAILKPSVESSSQVRAATKASPIGR
jgi:hypothetical protein